MKLNKQNKTNMGRDEYKNATELIRHETKRLTHWCVADKSVNITFMEDEHTDE